MSASAVAATTSTQSVAIGAYALVACTTGSYNHAIGMRCGNAITTGEKNVLIGHNTAYYMTTGNRNTAVGNYCMADGNVTSDKNSGYGDNACRELTTGEKTTGIGCQALYNLTTGDSNTAIGHNAGFSVTTGDNNTFLGDYARGSSTTDHQVVIGHNMDAGNTNYKVAIYNGQVNANFTGSASSWTFTSDGRDKTDIVDLDLGLDFIKKIQPRKFAWKYRKNNKHTRAADGVVKAGFIAQELQSVLSDYNASYTGIVNEDDPENLTVGQADLIPMMINAVKELSAENDAL